MTAKNDAKYESASLVANAPQRHQHCRDKETRQHQSGNARICCAQNAARQCKIPDVKDEGHGDNQPIHKRAIEPVMPALARTARQATTQNCAKKTGRCHDQRKPQQC